MLIYLKNFHTMKKIEIKMNFIKYHNPIILNLYRYHLFNKSSITIADNIVSHFKDSYEFEDDLRFKINRYKEHDSYTGYTMSIKFFSIHPITKEEVLIHTHNEYILP